MKILIKNRGKDELTVECGGRLKALTAEQEVVVELDGDPSKVAAELHFEEHNGRRFVTLWPAHGSVKA